MTAERALYLYAVVPVAAELRSFLGIADEPVAIVRSARLGVAASEVDVEALAEVNSGGADDAESLVALARRHDAVIREAAARAGAVLPFRLGTVVADPDAARRYLDASADALLAALGRVGGCWEWGVTVHEAHPGQAQQAAPAAAEAPVMRAAAGGAGTAYLARRRRELAHARELELARSQAGAGVASALRSRAADVTAGRARRSDALLCETYLVRRDAEAAFLEAVSLCDDQLKTCSLSLELSGPWPPYSFTPGLAVEADHG